MIHLTNLEFRYGNHLIEVMRLAHDKVKGLQINYDPKVMLLTSLIECTSSFF